MSKMISIASNAISAKLIDADDEARLIVSDTLSYYELGYENTWSFKNGSWDGTNTMFHWDTAMFPVGFLDAVNARLAKEGYSVRNLAKPLPAPLGELPDTLGGFAYTDKYDYQWRGVTELEKRGRMIARLATGAGKTFLAALCYTRIKRNTLILTKRKPLMYQFVERLETFGYEAGVIGDTRSTINSDLTVAMSQTVRNRIDEGDPEILAYLKTVEFIIGEEAHEISDDSYWKVIKHCPNAYYKLALTATPFMKDGSEANMKLLGAFGPVGLNVSEKLLIDRGVNATPKIKFVSYENTGKLRFNSNYQRSVELGITNSDSRNNAILEQALLAKQRGLPILTLIARQEHGKVLEALFTSRGIRTKFIFGDSSQKKRKEGLEELARGDIDALIGSTILDVGVDVPMIGCLILAGGGKAEVGFRQRIGRGLRSKPTGPNICLVVDFMDEHNVHLNDHFRERLKIIRETPGFAENLVDELPWKLFDLC
jgi:superfamily II DNA or RNA helicase